MFHVLIIVFFSLTWRQIAGFTRSGFIRVDNYPKGKSFQTENYNSSLADFVSRNVTAYKF